MAFYFPTRLKVWLSTLLLTLACLQLCPQLQQLQLFGLYLVIQLLLTLHLLLFLTKASTQIGYKNKMCRTFYWDQSKTTFKCIVTRYVCLGSLRLGILIYISLCVTTLKYLRKVAKNVWLSWFLCLSSTTHLLFNRLNPGSNTNLLSSICRSSFSM